MGSIREKLSKYTYNSVFVTNNFNVPALPDRRELEEVYFKGSVDTYTFKLTEDTNLLTAKEPSHFTFIPLLATTISPGQWIVELDIERHNNLSKYSNVVDTWVLPRRRKIVRALPII